jgi:hypothetical protein
MFIAGSIIHLIAINIALLTERESVQPSAVSSLQRPNIQFENALNSLSARLSSLTLGLRGKKRSVFTDT